MKVETWCSQNGITKANYYYDSAVSVKLILKQLRVLKLLLWNFLLCLNQKNWKNRSQKTCLWRGSILMTIGQLILFLYLSNRCHTIGAVTNVNDSHGFKKIYIATGYTDLRRGIDGLAAIIRFQFDLDPFDRNTLFLFCGRRSDRIKALLWEGDGFLLMYKRLNIGAFNWPRSADEAVEISQEEYERLMQGFEVIAKRPITEMKHPQRSDILHFSGQKI